MLALIFKLFMVKFFSRDRREKQNLSKQLALLLEENDQRKFLIKLAKH